MGEWTMWEATLQDDGQPCVFPLDDLKPHILAMDCWCRPFMDGNVIVHNVMDRREEYERGRLPS